MATNMYISCRFICSKIAHPDMAPQNLNLRSLTLQPWSLIVIAICETSMRTRSKVLSEWPQGLKFCGAISTRGRAIISLHQLFLFCIKTIRHHQVSKVVSSTHFWVFVKISLLFVNYFVSIRTPVRLNKLFSQFFLSVPNQSANVIDYVSV